MKLLERIESCKHIELVPLEEDKHNVSSYMWYFQDPDELAEMTPEERIEYTEGLLRSKYEVRCNGGNELCVATESPVMSLGMYGDLVQPMSVTIANSYLIKNCTQREMPEDSINGEERIDKFLTGRIKLD